MKTISQISKRALDVLKSEIESRNAFDSLEASSCISASRWKMAWYQNQNFTPEMLEFCCKEWPQYSVWLMTGEIPKSEVRQIMPRLAVEKSWEEILKTEPETWTEEDLQNALGSMLAIEVIREVGNGSFKEDLSSLIGRQKSIIKIEMTNRIQGQKPTKNTERDLVDEVEEAMPMILSKMKKPIKKKVAELGHKKD